MNLSMCCLLLVFILSQTLRDKRGTSGMDTIRTGCSPGMTPVDVSDLMFIGSDTVGSIVPGTKRVIEDETNEILKNYGSVTPETLLNIENEKRNVKSRELELRIAKLYEKCIKHLIDDYSPEYGKVMFCCYEYPNLGLSDLIEGLQITEKISEKIKSQGFETSTGYGHNSGGIDIKGVCGPREHYIRVSWKQK